MGLKWSIQKTLIFYSTLLIGALTISCSGEDGKVSDEGLIEYETKVIDENNPLAGFAPNVATLKFKNDKFLMEMSTMGMFNTMFIIDYEAKTITQMVKFLDLKQATIENEQDIIKENLGYNLEIEETKDTKIIAGYKCHKIKVKMVDDPSVRFDAYYTKEIQVDQVNSLSPYKGVHGMLMQYRLKKMGLELQFTAKKVKNVEVPDNSFEIPEHFKVVSKEEMQKFFSGLQ